MRAFVELIEAVERSPSVTHRVTALARFFRDASSTESAWCITWLLGKSKRYVSLLEIRDWGCIESGTEEWLWNECQAATGSVPETAAKLCAKGHSDACDLVAAFTSLVQAGKAEREAVVKRVWRTSDEATCYVWNKLISGFIRLTKGAHLISKALADELGLPLTTVAERLLEAPRPDAEWFEELTSPCYAQRRPFPFRISIPLVGAPESLGPCGRWHATYLVPGVPCQLAKRGASVLLWSQSDEILNDQYPRAIAAAEASSKSFVLDGVATSSGEFLAVDILELEAEDVRCLPLIDRIRLLEESGMVAAAHIALAAWEDLHAARAQARLKGALGILLRRLDAPYSSSKPSHNWRIWPCEPITIHAVLMYAHRADGQRYSNLTFGLLRQGELVSICKSIEGLSRRELEDLFAWIKANTLERIGPVRTVPPHQVFEIALERVERSTRHKCGFIVTTPRIKAWKRDLALEDADHLETLQRFANEPPKS